MKVIDSLMKTIEYLFRLQGKQCSVAKPYRGKVRGEDFRWVGSRCLLANA